MRDDFASTNFLPNLSGHNCCKSFCFFSLVGGVRTSTFADIALSYKDGTSDYRVSPFPIQGWGIVGEHIPDIVDTAGYTSFVQVRRILFRF